MQPTRRRALDNRTLTRRYGRRGIEIRAHRPAFRSGRSAFLSRQDTVSIGWSEPRRECGHEYFANYFAAVPAAATAPAPFGISVDIRCSTEDPCFTCGGGYAVLGVEMMGRAARWLVACVVTVAVFGLSLWVSGALLLPLVLKSGADRWVVAAALGVAMAALAALWGAWFAGRPSEVSSPGPGGGSITAYRDISGIASTGDGTTNIQQK